MCRILVRVEYANVAIYVLMVFTFSAIPHNHFRIAYREHICRDSLLSVDSRVLPDEFFYLEL